MNQETFRWDPNDVDGKKKYCKAASNNAAQLFQAKNLQPQNEKAPHLVFIVVDNSWDTYNLTSQSLVGHLLLAYIGEFRKIEDFKHFVVAKNFMPKSIIEIENRFLAAPFSIKAFFTCKCILHQIALYSR